MRELAPFKDDIPSHDMLSTVFRQLDPTAFCAAFSSWAQGLGERIWEAVVAIDGKTEKITPGYAQKSRLE